MSVRWLKTCNDEVINLNNVLYLSILDSSSVTKKYMIIAHFDKAAIVINVFDTKKEAQEKLREFIETQIRLNVI